MTFDWRTVKVGDAFTVQRDMMNRGGMTGYVISTGPYTPDTPSITSESVSLDFFCDIWGDPKGLPSIEEWRWDELDLSYYDED